MVTSIVGGQEGQRIGDVYKKGQRIGDVYKEGHRIGDVVQEASRRLEKDRLRVASFCELRTLIYSLCILPALTNSFSSRGRRGGASYRDWRHRDVNEDSAWTQEGYAHWRVAYISPSYRETCFSVGRFTKDVGAVTFESEGCYAETKGLK